jgi:hypothetical protein
MDEYQLEDGTGGYQLEDGTGNLLLEQQVAIEDPFPYDGGGYYG